MRAGGLPYIRIDGQLSPLSQEVVSPDLLNSILGKIITPHAKKIFDARGECDFSFEVENAARFRVNLFHSLILPETSA